MARVVVCQPDGSEGGDADDGCAQQRELGAPNGLCSGFFRHQTTLDSGDHAFSDDDGVVDQHTHGDH